MKRFTAVLSILLTAIFVVSACVPAATPTPDEKPTAMPAPTATPEPAPKPMNIVGSDVANGSTAALNAADLVETLTGAGPFTIFVPYDKAFSKLPAWKIDELLKPGNKQKLTDILLYHVILGKVIASDVISLTSATNMLGKDVIVSIFD